MKFLIQAIEGEVVHDFSFVLLESLRFRKWQGHTDYMAMITERNDINEPGWIPIGSVEFVQMYMKNTYKRTIRPKNVPLELQSSEYSGRHIFDSTEMNGRKMKLFAKSNDIIKGSCGITPYDLPVGRYQYSDIVDFSSEWRAFVWRGDLVGLHNYGGDFTEFPDVEMIKTMMQTFRRNSPCAYTLDVGLINNKTVVVEVHDFFSCGLYGFADLQLLPLMFGGWWKQWVNNDNPRIT